MISTPEPELSRPGIKQQRGLGTAGLKSVRLERSPVNVSIFT